MRGHLIHIFAILLLLGSCASPSQEGRSSRDDHSVLDSLSLPNHLSMPDSVTVIPKNAEPAHDIRFDRVLTIENGYRNEDNPDTFFGSVKQFTVGPENRIFIYSEVKIHVLSAEGKYVTSMGGEGRGPGEFRSLGRFTAPVQPKVNGDLLYAWDRELQRINVYNIQSLESIHTIALNPDAWEHVEELSNTGSRPEDYFPRIDRTLLVEFREPFSSPDGTWLDVAGTNPTPHVDKFRRSYIMNFREEIVSDKVFE